MWELKCYIYTVFTHCFARNHPENSKHQFVCVCVARAKSGKRGKAAVLSQFRCELCSDDELMMMPLPRALMMSIVFCGRAQHPLQPAHHLISLAGLHSRGFCGSISHSLALDQQNPRKTYEIFGISGEKKCFRRWK